MCSKRIAPRVLPENGGRPARAVKKCHARRIQIRCLGDVVIDRASLFRRKVQRGVERLLPQAMPFDVQRCGRLEFDQCRGRNRPFGVDDHVAGPHAAMQQLLTMHFAKRRKHGRGHDQRLGNRKWARIEAFFERHSRHVRINHEQVVPFVADVQNSRQPGLCSRARSVASNSSRIRAAGCIEAAEIILTTTSRASLKSVPR